MSTWSAASGDIRRGGATWVQPPNEADFAKNCPVSLEWRTKPWLTGEMRSISFRSRPQIAASGSRSHALFSWKRTRDAIDPIDIRSAGECSKMHLSVLTSEYLIGSDLE